MKIKYAVIAAALAFAGAAGATTVTLDSPLATNVSASSIDSFLQAGTGAHYYALNALASAEKKIELVAAAPDPAIQRAHYTLYVDNNNTAAVNDYTAVVAQFSGPVGGQLAEGSSSYISWLLQAGKQYILKIQASTGTTWSVSRLSSVSAVPLPGAVWLFGSALLGFLGFANRRKV